MSNLLKTKRLVDGDDLFRWRVEAACWAAGVNESRAALIAVASDPAVLESAKLTPPDTIDSSDVSDEAIKNAVEKYKENN